MSRRCQSTVGFPPADELPWGGDRYADEKTELLAYTCENPEGVCPVVAARKIINPDADGDSTEYQRVRRFFYNYPEYFETTRCDGYIWVEPTPKAFHLTTSKYSVGNADSGGIAKTNAEGYLSRRTMVEEDAVRGDLLGAHAARQEGVGKSTLAFEDQLSGERKTIPMNTRFTSGQRAQGTCARWHDAWDRSLEYEDAVCVTLTTHPVRYSSLSEIASTLRDDVNALKDWLAYEPKNGGSRLGQRVPSIVVREFTKKGVAHAHIVFFDTSFVARHEELSGYWDGNRGRGEIVWIDSMTNQDGEWQWDDPSDSRTGEYDPSGRPPRRYLGKTVAGLMNYAGATPSELHDAADALRKEQTGTPDYVQGCDWWQYSLYWATGLQFFTCSPGLRPSSEDNDDLPYVPRYKRISGAPEDHLPPHITENG